ncbi:hypothetical protein EN987_30690, partial [Mesorhizobium sp. M7A.F.Ca.CA.002.11.2.1]|uniref:hypothetical protein n=1 Tax=Mesorhizobium sp. M7A.F.Ca.CA.002.11.2.1 TaxID=2496734 RepID=UPI000FD57990
ATKLLVDDKLKIVKLFTPPFSKTEKDPGYIKSYPPGVRENGGVNSLTIFSLSSTSSFVACSMAVVDRAGSPSPESTLQDW